MRRILLILVLFIPVSLWANNNDVLQEEQNAVVNLSVCTMCVKPDFSTEMTTQALLGTPVRVLEKQGSWYKVQTPDDYVGFVHHVGICLMTEKQLRAWNAADKIIVKSHYASAYKLPNKNSQVVSDIVSGDLLKLVGQKGVFYKVAYPDGRTAYVEKRVAEAESKWLRTTKRDAKSIIQTAYSLYGIPYIWAGMSSKGVDCSGFVRHCLFMHGIIIPRDASQQAEVGERINIAEKCSNLKPGDLLFFGRKATDSLPERVVHVGMYIGGQKFIHSQGNVHVSSLNPKDSDYDAYNLGRLLYAGRILNHIGEKNITTINTNTYYTKR